MKNAKKSMFITTILMVAVLIVAVSTATFAWYTASGTGSASQATLQAAQSSAANIAVGWTSTSYTSTQVTFDSTAYEVSPMCPTATPTLGMKQSEMAFNTSTLNAVGNFNADGDTNVTPWAISSKEDATNNIAKGQYTSFFVINNNQNAEANVKMTINYLDATNNTNNNKLVVAVFGKQGDATDATLLGIFCNADQQGNVKGFVAGTIQNDTAPSTLATITSSSDATPVKSEIVITLATAGSTGSFAELTVYAWLDGTALGQEGATKTASFSFSFNA